MKKFMYLLLGAASAILYTAVVVGRAETKGAARRRVARHLDRASSVEDEISGPLNEV